MTIRRGAAFKSGLAMHVPWLVALCYIGAITHPLLDLQTTYAVQLLSPFDTRWFHAETLFIIDVWIWSALALAIWLSRRREKKAGDWRRPAIVGLTLVCGYIGLNGAITACARAELVMTEPNAQPEVLIAGEQPVLFWKRDLIWRQNGMIGRASYDPLQSIDQLSEVQPLMPDNMGDPLVRRAMRADPGMAAFMRWSIIPYAKVVLKGCAAEVSIGDARFGMDMGRGPLRRVVTLPFVEPGCRTRPTG
jgi:inner membrane protein